MSENPYVGFFGEREQKPLSYKGDNHLVTIGPPGTGKSSGLYVPNLALLDRSILVIDPKGELAAITAQHRKRFGPVFVLNPFQVLADRLPFMRSCGFNPLAALNPASPRFVDDCKALAQGIVKVEGVDPHWSRSAQSLVAALMMHARRTRGAAANLVMVRDLLTETRGHYIEDGRPIPTGLDATILQMVGSDFAPIYRRAGKYVNDTKETSSIISTAEAQSEFLDSPPIGADLSQANSFDFADMRRMNLTVYLVLPFEEIATHANWLRLIVAAALRALTQNPDQVGRPRVLFMLDEFANLGYLEAIRSAMAAARGFRIQMWPGVQNIGQLKELYGDNWETFLAGAGFQGFFTPRDMTTARYISERCGLKDTTQRSRSHDHAGNISHGYHTGQQPRLSINEVFGIPDRMAACFQESMGDGFFCEVPHYTDSRLYWCRGLAANPYDGAKLTHHTPAPLTLPNANNYAPPAPVVTSTKDESTICGGTMIDKNGQAIDPLAALGWSEKTPKPTAIANTFADIRSNKNGIIENPIARLNKGLWGE